MEGSVKSYTLAFVSALILTLTAFGFVIAHDASAHWLFDHDVLKYIIINLGIVQLYIQLVYFMHLGSESKPRYKSVVFIFMSLILVIFVGGSLWIMQNLNYHMMDPLETQIYMQDHEGF